MKRSPIIFACGVVAAFALSSTAFAGSCIKGLTWGYYGKSVNASNVTVTGAIYVGCKPVGSGCDPHHGDYKCKKALPILCINQDATAFPQPANVANPNAPNDAWAFGVVGTTTPVRPCLDLAGYGGGNGTLSAATAFCKAEFGNSWRVAEWHDGSFIPGQGFQAHGGVGISNKRFWMDINDEPDGTCWDESK